MQRYFNRKKKNQPVSTQKDLKRQRIDLITATKAAQKATEKEKKCERRAKTRKRRGEEMRAKRSMSPEEKQKLQAEKEQYKKNEQEKKRQEEVQQRIRKAKNARLMSESYPYEYDEESKKYYRPIDSRPTNQNHVLVLEKITNRLEKIENENKNSLTQLQKNFIEEEKAARATGKSFLKSIDTHIAHNIAIEPILQAIEDRMNGELQNDSIQEIEEFVDDILSSDGDFDEEAEHQGENESKNSLRVTSRENPGKVEIKRFFASLKAEPATPEAKRERCKDANYVVWRLNRASRNLMPGYSSTNSAIQDKRDPHMIKNNMGGFKETEMSHRLAISARALLGNTHKPRLRNKDGYLEAQSSSINAVSEESYVRYESPKRTS